MKFDTLWAIHPTNSFLLSKRYTKHDKLQTVITMILFDYCDCSCGEEILLVTRTWVSNCLCDLLYTPREDTNCILHIVLAASASTTKTTTIAITALFAQTVATYHQKRAHGYMSRFQSHSTNLYAKKLWGWDSNRHQHNAHNHLKDSCRS